MNIDPSLIQKLAEQLKGAVRDSRPVETAQVQIIGLDEVKRQVGAQWGEWAGRMRETSLDFISQRIGPNDVVIPAGDGFVVIYADPEGSAEVREGLQDALNSFYMTDESTQALSASVRTESLGPDMLMQSLARPQAVPFWEAATSSAPADLPLAVLPVWSVAQEAVTGYWIAPEQLGRAVGRFAYDPTWTETGWHREDKDFLELDLRILDRAVREIQACLARGRRCLVGFSVHSTTLLNRNRRRTYLQALSAAPGDTRPLLQGRIAELESGTPIGQVAEWSHQLRQVSHRLDIEIHHTQRDVSGINDIGVSGLACVIPAGHPSPADVAALSLGITVWSRDAKRQNLKLRLDNVEDPRLLGQALDVQIDACTSPRLWPPVPAPDGVKPYSREQFLKALPATAAERRSA